MTWLPDTANAPPPHTDFSDRSNEGNIADQAADGNVATRESCVGETARSVRKLKATS